MKVIVILIILFLVQTSLPIHNFAQTKNDWLHSFDLDGDGKNDQIEFDFTGGGHCCYKIKITLSTTSKTIKFPFQMDGGYVSGVDNSQPEQFDIKDIDDDGLPEILMKIESYNAELNQIPQKWQKRYGFKTNFIVIEFEKRKLRVRDQKKNEPFTNNLSRKDVAKKLS